MTLNLKIMACKYQMWASWISLHTLGYME